MSRPTLEERMENLEQIVEPLRALPERLTKVESRLTTVESQIVHLRVEMRGEFSAIRRDMPTKEDLAEFPTRDDLTKCATKDDLTRFATKDHLSKFATKDDLARFATRDDLARLGRGLRRQVQGLHTRMLVLHEDLVERLKILGEAWSRPRRASKKASKKPRRP